MLNYVGGTAGKGEQLSKLRKALPVPESRTNLKQIKLNVSHQHSSSKQGATQESDTWLSKRCVTCSEEKAFLSDSCSNCDDSSSSIFWNFKTYRQFLIQTNIIPVWAKFSINNSAPLGRYKGTDHRTRKQWQLVAVLVACTQTKMPLTHKYIQRHSILWKDSLYRTGNCYKNMVVVPMNSTKEIKTHGQEKCSEQF